MAKPKSNPTYTIDGKKQKLFKSFLMKIPNKKTKKRVYRPNKVVLNAIKKGDVLPPKEYGYYKVKDTLVELGTKAFRSIRKKAKVIFPKEVVYDVNKKKILDKKKVLTAKGKLKKEYSDTYLLDGSRIIKKKIVETQKKKAQAQKVVITYTLTSKVKYEGSGEFVDYQTTRSFTQRKTSSVMGGVFNDMDKWGNTLYNEGIEEAQQTNYSNVKTVDASIDIDPSSFKLNHTTLYFDGKIKNPEWDNGNYSCVYDYLVWKYADRKGAKKITKKENLYELFNRTEYNRPLTQEEYETLTDDQLSKISVVRWYWDEDKDGYDLEEMISYEDYLKDYWGVSLTQLKRFCEMVRIAMYVKNQDNKTIYMYEPQKRNTALPPLIFLLANNHIYPIEDDSERKSVVASENKNNFVKEKKNESVEVNYNIIEVRNIDPYQHIIDKMEQTGIQVLNRNVKMCGSQILSYTLEGDKYVFINDSEKNWGRIYYEENGIDYNGEHITSVCGKYIKEYVKHFSTPNHIVNDILFKDKVKHRVQIGQPNGNKLPLDFFTSNNNLSEYSAYDINKCYSKCITEPYENWILLDYNALPIKYNGGKVELGLYYIRTTDTTLLHKSNIYSSVMVEYALKEGIISYRDIKWYIPASKSLEKSYFQLLFNKYKKGANGNVKLNKIMNNLTTGMLGKSFFRRSTINISTSLDECWNYLCENNENSLFCKEHNDIYIYGKKIEQKLEDHNIPFYIQVLDNSNIRLYEMGKKLGGEIVYRKTDCLVVKNANEIKCGKKWGEYSKEHLPSLMLNVNYDRDVNIELKEYGEWRDVKDIDDSSDWKKILNVLVSKRGLMINGDAGTGKSYVIKNISKNWTDLKCAKLCFTNKGAININGQTIHKFLAMDKDGMVSSKRIDTIVDEYGLIIIDEVSMVSSYLWKRLHLLYRRGLKFLLVGDWKQIPPVEPNVNAMDYREHPAVKDLGNRWLVNLTKIHRYDLALKDVSRNVMNVNTNNFPQYICKRNICYTNKTRKFVNSLLNKEIMITKTNVLKMKNMDGDIYIYKDLLVIADKTKGDDYVNNEEFKVNSYNDKYIFLKNERPNDNGEAQTYIVSMKWKEFLSTFKLAYCITTHKSQGSTIDCDITIWDWDMMDERLRYTAITRATSLGKINFRTI